MQTFITVISSKITLLAKHAIKQRPMDNPLIVPIADTNQANNWVAKIESLAGRASSTLGQPIKAPSQHIYIARRACQCARVVGDFR